MTPEQAKERGIVVKPLRVDHTAYNVWILSDGANLPYRVEKQGRAMWRIDHRAKVERSKAKAFEAVRLLHETRILEALQ